MKMAETLYFYDEPLLATFLGDDDNTYLGIKMEDDTNQYPECEKPFLLAPISKNTLQKILDNTLRLRTAFEDSRVWYVCDVLKNTEKLFDIDYETAKPHFPGNVYLSRS